MSDVSFVRHDEIPPSPPPMRETGVVKWLRENLFSSWINGALTIIAVYCILRLVIGVFPWFANGVWTGSSLAECRAALEGATGACFAVLVERWNQLLFGISYPATEYWRPTLAFVLLFGAAAPAMFFMVLPRKMLIFTGIYPFLAYWLIWGGSLLGVVVGLLGLVAGAYAFLWGEKRSGFALGALAAIVVAVVVWRVGGFAVNEWRIPGLSAWQWWLSNALGALIAWGVFQALKVRVGTQISVVFGLAALGIWFAVITPPLSVNLGAEFYNLQSGTMSLVLVLEPVASRDMGGYMLSLILGTVCISLSLPIGIALALGRQSDMLIIKWICVIFIEFIRGVPLITLLFVANVVLAYFFPPEVNLDLILRVMIMMTLFSSAYIAETVRGGLAALPKGQYEAADSLGLNYSQSMRLIVLPQALKISIPSIVNVAVGLFKDTTLVSVISIFDVVGAIRGPILGSTQWTGIYWELLGAAALLFFPICYGISQYSQWLERQLATDHR